MNSMMISNMFYLALTDIEQIFRTKKVPFVNQQTRKTLDGRNLNNLCQNNLF